MLLSGSIYVCSRLRFVLQSQMSSTGENTHHQRKHPGFRPRTHHTGIKMRVSKLGCRTRRRISRQMKGREVEATASFTLLNENAEGPCPPSLSCPCLLSTLLALAFPCQSRSRRQERTVDGKVFDMLACCRCASLTHRSSHPRACFFSTLLQL